MQSVCVFCAIRVCVCVQSVCVFVCNPCVCLCAIRVCVWPGVPKVSYFTVSGVPGVRQNGKNLKCCGSPPPPKIDFRSGMCVFFGCILLAKTTIGRSMCVFVCNPCVCVCVGRRKIGKSMGAKVCNPCVCLPKRTHTFADCRFRH